MYYPACLDIVKNGACFNLGSNFDIWWHFKKVKAKLTVEVNRFLKVLGTSVVYEWFEADVGTGLASWSKWRLAETVRPFSRATKVQAGNGLTERRWSHLLMAVKRKPKLPLKPPRKRVTEYCNCNERVCEVCQLQLHWTLFSLP